MVRVSTRVERANAGADPVLPLASARAKEPDLLALDVGPAPGRAGAADVSVVHLLGLVDAACGDRQRAAATADLLDERLRLTKDLAAHAAVVIWATATTRDAPGTEGLMPAFQGVRALEILRELDPGARADFEALVASTRSHAERAVLLKELSCLGTDAPGDFIARMRPLADTIRGRDLDWLVDMTTVYGLVSRPGLAPAFTKSCGPTAGLIAEAESRPSLALRLALDERPPDDPRSFAATYQRRVLEAHGGKAVPFSFAHRLRTGTVFSGGKAMKLEHYIEDVYARLGVKLASAPMASMTQAARRECLDAFERALRLGADLPIETTQTSTGLGHCELVVDCYRRQGIRFWRIQDQGETRDVADDAFVTCVLGPDRELHALWYPQ